MRNSNDAGGIVYRGQAKGGLSTALEGRQQQRLDLFHRISSLDSDSNLSTRVLIASSFWSLQS